MANTTNKMTHAKALAYVLSMELPADVKADLEKLQASLAKKNSKDGEPKTDANAEFKAIAVESIADGFKGTCTDFIKSIPAFAEFSTSKMSRILNDLANDKLIGKETIKGKSIFGKVKATEPTEDAEPIDAE